MVVGKVTAAQEHTITLLKGARLLLELKRDQPPGRAKPGKVMLGKQAIVNAITRLNDKSSTRIITCLPDVKLHSATRVEILARGLKPYCENNTLSIGNPGCVYKALQCPLIRR